MKKSICAFLAYAFLLSLSVAPCRANLIINGSFEDPSVQDSFAVIPNGSVPGWTGLNNQNGMEIDYTPILSSAGTPAYDGRQSTEVDDTFVSITQSVTGLTVGAQYTLSWAYGLRPLAGAQSLDVYFGGTLVAHDGGVADPNVLLWTFNSFIVTAESATEALTFTSVSTQLFGTGNEIDAVSLNPVSVPEPSSLVMMSLAAIGALGYGMRGSRKHYRRASDN